MFTRYSFVVATTLLGSLLSLPVWAKDSEIEEIFVFGNSISDTGNVFNLTNGTFPPSTLYDRGRFSNGPVWIDYLEQNLGINTNNFYGGDLTSVGEGLNFSIGGATTGTTTLGDTPEFSFPGVTTQVNNFIDYLGENQINEDALFILWAGENDYVQAAQNGEPLDPTIPINNIANSLNKLADAGAKNILVANLVNAANTPIGQDLVPPEQLEQLTLLTDAHNTALNSVISSLETSYSDTDIALLDANTLLENIYNNPTDFGFISNPIESCLSPNNFPDIAPNAVPCDNPDEYVYYDNQHFTTSVHKLIADKASETIDREFTSNSAHSVPESGNIMALIGLGLGITTGLVKKRQFN
jgi:phospholipase/lecithinase/hemolysin